MPVQTVTKKIERGQLGIAAPHEHIMLDLSGFFRPRPVKGVNDPSTELVKMENLGILNRDPYALRDNLLLDDPDLQAEELIRFRDAGGQTVFDATMPGIGRDPVLLREISHRTGLNIVAGTGYYVGATHPSRLESMVSEDIAEIMIIEIQDGIADTGVRAGFIGEIGISEAFDERERRVLRAAAMASDDRAVRKTALSALADGSADAAIPYLSRALDDSDPELRRYAVGLLADISPRTGQVTELLEIASEDRDAGVQKAANIALEPFSVKSIDEVPLRERPEFEDKLDRIEVVISKRLPGSGWKFKKDPGLAGHRQEWFCPGYDDSDWVDIRIEEPWEAGYIGVGWYRKSIELPERTEHIAAELKFEGVDENAWVWVNGEYAGGQAVGPAGWNRPFRVDITGELEWNTENQVTVRVKNTIGAGGIWRPVYLEVLNMD